jgi:hypothetical protein
MASPYGLKRFQKVGALHFVALGCFHPPPLFETAEAGETFEADEEPGSDRTPELAFAGAKARPILWHLRHD